jgi:hypothetical protein
LHNGSSGCSASVSLAAARIQTFTTAAIYATTKLNHAKVLSLSFRLLYYHFSLYACACLYSWNERTNEKRRKEGRGICRGGQK